jgi:carbonic anhydrase
MAFLPRRLLISLPALATIVTVTSAPSAQSPHWGYSGEAGPDHWARLAPEFAPCAGRNQSPIDLTGFIEADLAPIQFAYAGGGALVVNTGHGVQVNFAQGSSIVVDGVRFGLLQVHFHAPSENTITGRSFSMEAHLVHADSGGHLAVVAVMFDEGRENPVLAPLWSAMPGRAGGQATLAPPLDAASLLPADRAYYRFNGSLTTPPCTEGVRWLVLKTPLSLSREQVAAFSRIIEHPNNRPVQPVNARTVLQ